MALYDRIGLDYDATRRADPYLVSRLLAHLDARPGARVLDLACGTGNYTLALSEAGLDVCGLDASDTMLAALRRKAPQLPLRRGAAEAVPFGDRAFDGATCTLAVHHFGDRARAFAEVRRVLRAGRFVLFTAGRAQMRGYWLNAYFPRAMAASIEQMPSARETAAELRRAGFARVDREPYDVRPDLQDLFLYSGKHRPHLYFDARVRAGISTFAALAEPGEVQAGLARLKHDLDSGRFARVRDAYENDRGDYLFLVAGA